MTLEFFKLKEQPFAAPPNPRFLYLSSTHREALASLLGTLQADRGLVTLVAQPGLGKTTLLFHILNSFGGKVATVYVAQAAHTPVDLLRAILADLGAREMSKNFDGMVSQLKDLLSEERRLGKRVVVVIDDAQNLDTAVFDLLRMLSNFKSARGQLVQFVLCGQPMLSDKLASIKPLHAMQRGAPVAHLEPFATRDIALYLDHRLRTAGYAREAPLFTPEAAALIARYSQGSPRVINSLCSEALYAACRENREQIGSETVLEAAATLNLTTPKQQGISLKPLQLSSAPPSDSRPAPFEPAADTDTVLAVQPQAVLSPQPSPAAPSTTESASASTEQLALPAVPSQDELVSASDGALTLSPAAEEETPGLAPPVQPSLQAPDDVEDRIVSADRGRTVPLKTFLDDTLEAMSLKRPDPLFTPTQLVPEIAAQGSIVTPEEVLPAAVAPNGSDDSQEKTVRMPAQRHAEEKATAEGQIVPPKVRQPAARQASAPPTLMSSEKSIAASRWHTTFRARRNASSRAKTRKKMPASPSEQATVRAAPTAVASEKNVGSTPWWLAPAATSPVVPEPTRSPAQQTRETPTSVMPAAPQEAVASKAETVQPRLRWLLPTATQRSRRDYGTALRGFVSRPLSRWSIAALLLVAVTGVVFGLYRTNKDRATGQIVAASPVLHSSAPVVQRDQVSVRIPVVVKAKPAAGASPNAAKSVSSTHDLKAMDLASALQALSDQKRRARLDQPRARENDQ